MKVFTQLSLIFCVCLLGQLVASMLPVAFPGSVMGMLLMLLLLCLKVVKLSQIKETAEFLLSNMAFFFIPAGVGVTAYYDKLSGKVTLLLLVIALTTLITFLVTAYTIMGVLKIQAKRKEELK